METTPPKGGWKWVYRMGYGARELSPKSRLPYRGKFRLHLVEITDAQWQQYLTFRDILRSDAALRAQYAALKSDLARVFPDNRKAYTAGKHEFIQRVLTAL